MKRRLAASLRRWPLWAPALAAVVLWSMEALARPGGGQSYSGGGGGGFSGGGSYSSSSSSGGGEGIGLLIWLVFEHPVIGVPLCIGIGIFWVISQKSKNQGWSSGGSSDRFGVAEHFSQYTSPVVAPPSPRSVSAQLDTLRKFDPNFSRPLFEDFVYTLFAKAHEARGDNQLDLLAPYITEPARQTLARLADVQDVRGVIVGAMSILSVDPPLHEDDSTTVLIRFEANYTEIAKGGHTQNFYVVETWTLRRRFGVLTKAPDEVSIHQCPACGAAQEQSGHGTCNYCGQRVDTGAFDWVVVAVFQTEKSPRQPQLTGTVPERGTNQPTIKDREALPNLEALKQRDPQFDYLQFQERVKLIYRSLNEAWVGKKWEKARPFLTNDLFQSQRYWIEEYKKQKLTNHMDEAQLGRMDLCKVSADKFYDAVTVRVFARAKDYTTSDDSGQVVGGDPNLTRAYSEYWTFIRRAGVSKATTTEANCPSCGAGLDVNMAGECGYCGSTITKGDFDWVLSRIEQDESYRG